MSADNVNPFSDLDLGVTVRGLVPGQKVMKRYTLERVLGRGGMGVVWLAYDEMLTRKVALKFLPEVLAKDRSALEELKREAKRSLELSHPNIVRFYDFLQDEQCAGISMEYISGDSLANLRLDQPGKIFEVAEIQVWVRQLCQALQYAHEEVQIVHRDLKPANLMVDSQGRMKVTDFGIARSVSDSYTRMTMKGGGGGVAGTLVYMSPQQAMGDAPSIQDDIYSFGATLYELLTSKPPFFSGEIIAQVREKVPPPLQQRRREFQIEGKKIPLNWEKTIAACLQKDAAKRPATAWEVIERLGLEVRGSRPAGGVKPAAAAVVAPEMETTVEPTKADPEAERRRPRADSEGRKPASEKKPSEPPPKRHARSSGMMIEIETEIGGILPEIPEEKIRPATAKPTTGKVEPVTTPPKHATEPPPSAPKSTPPAPLPTQVTPVGPALKPLTEPPRPTAKPASAAPLAYSLEPIGDVASVSPPKPETQGLAAPPPISPGEVARVQPPPAPAPLPLITPPPTAAPSRDTGRSTAPEPPKTVPPPPTAAAPPATTAPPTEIQPIVEPTPAPAEVELPPTERGEPRVEPVVSREEPAPEIAVVEPVEEIEPPRPIVPELSPEERAEAREARARRMQKFLKIAAVVVLLAGAGFGVIKFFDYWKTWNAGELAIKTTPSSADINLVRDGRPVGSRALFTGLNPGTYVLVVSAPGYESYTNDSLVLEGLSGTSLAKKKEVEVNLSLMVGGAALTISPPDATYNLASVTLAAGTSTNLTGKGLATLANLPLGSYTVRVSREGYGTQSTNIEVTQTELARINLELQREMGLLALASTPPGAKYRLMGPDEIRRQGTTPVTETNLPTGSYTVQVELADHDPLVTNAVVVANATANATYALARCAGTLQFSVNVSRAAYAITGPVRLQGDLTAQFTQKLPTGDYEIKITSPGYQDFARKVSIVANATEDLRVIDLRRITGVVELASQPPGAVIKVANAETNKTLTAGNAVDLPVGTYEATARLEGYKAHTETIQITAERPVKSILKLTRSEGRVAVAFTPADAIGSIRFAPNQNLLGTNLTVTSGADVSLPTGDYLLELTKEHHQPVTKAFTVTEGQTTPIEPITMQHLKGGLEVAFQPAEATLVVGEPGSEDFDCQTNSTPGQIMVKEDGLKIHEKYPVRVALPGFDPYVGTVAIRPGVITKLPLITLPRQTGTLRVVVSSPAQVQVSLMGPAKLLPGDEPVKKSGLSSAALAQVKLPTGQYTVWVEARGHEPQTNQVQVTAGPEAIADFKSLTRSTGMLFVDTKPANGRFKLRMFKPEADVAEEWQPITNNAPLLLEGLPTGLYVIEAARPRGSKWAREAGNTWQATNQVSVTRNSPITNTIVFPFTQVTIETEPPGAEIKHEGKVVRPQAGPPLALPEFGLEEKAQFEVTLEKYRDTTIVVDGTQLALKAQESLVAPAYKLQPFPGPQRSRQRWTNSLGMVFVRIDDRVMMCTWECRVKDYDKFDRAWLPKHRDILRAIPGVTDTAIPCLPVVMVSWSDATRFCEKLTEGEIRDKVISPSHRYRLPKDLEWSQAVGLNVSQEKAAGNLPKDRHLKSTGLYSWGGGRQWPPPIGAGNYPGYVSYDRYPGLAPVGMFAPNHLGMFDLGGNAWEWCEEPFDNTSDERVVRGNSWNWDSHQFYIAEDVFNASYRHHYPPLKAYNDVGFRCVIELTE